MSDTLFTPGTVITSAWLNDVNTNTYALLTAVLGTPNAITANAASTVVVGYPRAIGFRFIPTATNTGPATININNLGVKSLTKYGAQPLVAGDIAAGVWALIAYDGTQFQLINPLTPTVQEVGRLLNVQRFTASGNYTPTPGTNSIIFESVGAAGGSSGSVATGAGQYAFGGAGGAGAYVKHRVTSGFAGQAFVIGAAGAAGGAGTAGGAGGATTFLGTSAGGGGGGTPSSPLPASALGNSGSGTASGGNILNVNGATPAILVWNATALAPAGLPGSGSPFGTGGGATFSNSAAPPGAGFGSSGGMSQTVPSSAAQLGVAGQPGLLIIYEYS
jgi:hypothetical protein